jgi:hypothetical protein
MKRSSFSHGILSNWALDLIGNVLNNCDIFYHHGPDTSREFIKTSSVVIYACYYKIIVQDLAHAFHLKVINWLFLHVSWLTFVVTKSQCSHASIPPVLQVEDYLSKLMGKGWRKILEIFWKPDHKNSLTLINLHTGLQKIHKYGSLELHFKRWTPLDLSMPHVKLLSRWTTIFVV